MLVILAAVEIENCQFRYYIMKNKGAERRQKVSSKLARYLRQITFKKYYLTYLN